MRRKGSWHWPTPGRARSKATACREADRGRLESHRQSSEGGRRGAARIALRFGRRGFPPPGPARGEGGNPRRPDRAPAPLAHSLLENEKKEHEEEEEGADVRDTEADMPRAETPGAMCVQRFDDSRALQFTLRIAVRCVLHRCGSLDIRR